MAPQGVMPATPRSPARLRADLLALERVRTTGDGVEQAAELAGQLLGWDKAELGKQIASLQQYNDRLAANAG